MFNRGSFGPIDDAELQEMLVGTWLAIAVVADELAARGDIDRQSLVARLIKAERSCGQSDGRARAVGVVELLFATFGEAGEDIRITLH